MYHFFVGLALVVLFPVNLVLSRSEFPISSYLVFDVLRSFVKKSGKGRVVQTLGLLAHFRPILCALYHSRTMSVA
jgi:hypothetical protein